MPKFYVVQDAACKHDDMYASYYKGSWYTIRAPHGASPDVVVDPTLYVMGTKAKSTFEVIEGIMDWSELYQYVVEKENINE